MMFLMGLFLIGVGVYMLWHSYYLHTQGVFTFGTVTKLYYHRRGHSLAITYKTKKNRTRTFISGGFTIVGTTYPLFHVGDIIPVLYNPHNSSDAIIYSLDIMYLMPLCFIGVGILLTYQGCILLSQPL